MGMRRYLVVLDMDLLAADEELDLEPISYLAAQQEREPCETVVLSPPSRPSRARGRGSFPSRPSRVITSGRPPNTV